MRALEARQSRDAFELCFGLAANQNCEEEPLLPRGCHTILLHRKVSILMAILLRRNGGVWLPALRKKFVQEYELRDLLLKTPELVEVLDGSKLVLTKEAGL